MGVIPSETRNPFWDCFVTTAPRNDNLRLLHDFVPRNDSVKKFYGEYTTTPSVGECPLVRFKMNFVWFKDILKGYRERILKEVLEIKGLMYLLMKVRNNYGKWTEDEKKEIKGHLKEISKMVPALFIFLLPGGSILLPVLTALIDRRKAKRKAVV